MNPTTKDFEQESEIVPIDNYGYTNYAVVIPSSAHDLFDLLRYEDAYFFRSEDVERIIRIATDDPYRWRYQIETIVLAKHDYKEQKKATWTRGRVPKRINFHEVTFDEARADPSLQILVDSFKKKKPVRFRMTGNFTGNLPWILRVMHANQAFPGDETSAHILEEATSIGNVTTEINVCLSRFVTASSPWKLQFGS